jgi:hypothetical protein
VGQDGFAGGTGVQGHVHARRQSVLQKRSGGCHETHCCPAASRVVFGEPDCFAGVGGRGAHHGADNVDTVGDGS